MRRQRRSCSYRWTFHVLTWEGESWMISVYLKWPRHVHAHTLLKRSCWGRRATSSERHEKMSFVYHDHSFTQVVAGRKDSAASSLPSSWHFILARIFAFDVTEQSLNAATRFLTSYREVQPVSRRKQIERGSYRWLRLAEDDVNHEW